MRRHTVTIRYTFLQGSYWASYCAVLAFSSIYLLSRGFSNAQIGILLSVSGLLSALLQPLLSRKADGLKKISLRQFTGGLVLCQLIAGGLLLILSQKLSQTILYGLLIVLVNLIMPLCSALGMEALNNGYSLNFGVARGMGSITYGVCSILLGKLVLWFGEISIPLGMLVLNLLLLLSVFLFRFYMRKERQTVHPTESKHSGRPFLFQYHSAAPLLIGVVCLFISHHVLNVYTYQIVQPLGGDSGQMGTLLFIQAIVELPVMFTFALLLKKGSRLWMRISGISFFLHALGTWAAPNMGVLYLVQIFEMTGYALYILSSVYYINERVKETERVQGQAWFSMAITLGSVLASFVGGFLLDHAGVPALLAFATITGGVGMGILWVLLKEGRLTLMPK